MHGELLPGQGFTQSTLMNNFQCFKYEDFGLIRWLVSCDPTHCCVTEYAVEHLPGHDVTIRRNYSPIPYPNLEDCANLVNGPCTYACAIDFMPRIAIDDSKSFQDKEHGITINRSMYSIDGINFNLEFLALSDGRLTVDFYNYLGEKLYSYENLIKNSTLNIESINLAKLNGFVLYNISFNDKIVFVGKIMLDK